MAKFGAFTFVLHCHLPYCRLSGDRSLGEAWVHKAVAETYVPLLNSLFDLYHSGIPARLTLDLTPILCEQLADKEVKEHILAYLIDTQARAEADVSRFLAAGELQRARLAEWYLDWYATITESFVHRYRGDVVGAFRRLQDLGVIEIVTSTATHAYLPSLASNENVSAQLHVAARTHTRHFRRMPRGVWLPESAYRPGLEAHLSRETLGFRFILTDARPLMHGRVVGCTAGYSLSESGSLGQHYTVACDGTALCPGSTFQPYYIGTDGNSAHSGVAIIAGNERAVAQVSRLEESYIRDPVYRDFHRHDAESGLQYWRNADPADCLGCLDEWEPKQAQQRTSEHARHFTRLVTDLLEDYANRDGRYGLLCAGFSAELFGHRWFEGVDWLRETLQLLSESEKVELATAGDFLERHPPDRVLALSATPLGQGDAPTSKEDGPLQALWQAVNQAEQRMTAFARRFRDQASVERELLLAQLARENLLMQSSDWEQLITTRRATEYALQRFNTHLQRFNQLADALEHNRYDVHWLSDLYQDDKVFPDLDWRFWA